MIPGVLKTNNVKFERYIESIIFGVPEDSWREIQKILNFLEDFSLKE